MADCNAPTFFVGIINYATETASKVPCKMPRDSRFGETRYKIMEWIKDIPVIESQVSLWQINPPEPVECEEEDLFERVTNLKKGGGPELRRIDYTARMTTFDWRDDHIQIILLVESMSLSLSSRQALSSLFSSQI